MNIQGRTLIKILGAVGVGGVLFLAHWILLPVPVPVTGVRYNSLLWMCTLNTDLTWPDLTRHKLQAICDVSLGQSFRKFNSRSSQCSTTGVTKVVVYAILSVGWCL